MPLLDTYSMRPAEATEIEASNICYERNKVCEEFLHDSTKYNTHQTLKWLQSLPASSKRFIIDRDFKDAGLWPYSERFAAVCRVDHIDLINQTCYVGLDITEAFRGKGLSYPFWEMLLNHVFLVMNMRQVYLEVLDTNERAKKIYYKLFFYSGLYRHKVYKSGKYVDSMIFDLDKETWLERKEKEKCLTVDSL
jgi:RimJ/RimL family protein N-acetyltransferase